MVRVWLCTAVLALILAQSVAAQAAGKTALVIGTASYDHGPDLRTPHADAHAIAGRLGALGYQAFLALDPTQDQMLIALARFRAASRDASEVVIYVAGHGVRWRGETFLLARDTPTADAGAMLASSVPLRVVLASVSDKVRTKIILIDACRDVPLDQGAIATAKADPSQATAAGAFILHAAQPGSVAQDGTGPHSPFANAVLNALTVERGLAEFARAVRGSVVAQTQGLQIPWSESSMLTDARIGSP